MADVAAASGCASRRSGATPRRLAPRAETVYLSENTSATSRWISSPYSPRWKAPASTAPDSYCAIRPAAVARTGPSLNSSMAMRERTCSTMGMPSRSIRRRSSASSGRILTAGVGARSGAVLRSGPAGAPYPSPSPSLWRRRRSSWRSVASGTPSTVAARCTYASCATGSRTRPTRSTTRRAASDLPSGVSKSPARRAAAATNDGKSWRSRSR